MDINWELFDKISYRSNLGTSLRKTLRRFDKEALFDELYDILEYYVIHTEDFPYDYRVKPIHSSNRKYDRYYPSKELERVYNDLLGIRIVVNSYADVFRMDLPSSVRLVDLSEGKKYDDGYRGIHLYYQKDHFHYPIEVQLWTPDDKRFNEWLHIMVYKYYNDINIGYTLREKYDNGEIKNENDFRKELANVLLNR